MVGRGCITLKPIWIMNVGNWKTTKDQVQKSFECDEYYQIFTDKKIDIEKDHQELSLLGHLEFEDSNKLEKCRELIFNCA
ncbi:Hypothetical predicted protein [Octopus vulgaris]|uniref:Uncharacterized protein n=1 Tax=Octopus vulgaris TaxID=6645 RepID=A0AA36AY82_OCTVU|nr:Hypothetical predicted protein [Octopus vulgaris]